MLSNRFSSFSVQSLLALFMVVLLLSLLGGCGGGGGSDPGPSNVGGGYTLVVSGGTLNDGSGTDGLVILATLRNDAGNGPAMPWSLAIAGPGLGTSLRVSYDDGSPSSYMTWWWEGLDPLPGQYTATATDGTTTLVYTFTLQSATVNLSQPALVRNVNTVSWDSVTGAGSYYYRVIDGTGGDVIQPGYFNAGQSQYSFELPALDDGSYLIEVYAMSSDRDVLGSDPSPWPKLASPEKMSLKAIEFMQGGGYFLNAKGGVLYGGKDRDNNYADTYGLVVWTSINTAPTTSAVSPTPPAGDWNVTVTDPDAQVFTFTYPRNDSQYVYWTFELAPLNTGTYTVSATPAAGGATISTTFSITNPTEQFPLSTVAATATAGGGGSVAWSPVSGANSYYVNIYAIVNNVYTEIAGTWVTGTSATIASGTLAKDVEYDVYITACPLNMTDTTTTPPLSPGAEVNMSDTTFSYSTIFGK